MNSRCFFITTSKNASLGWIKAHIGYILDTGILTKICLSPPKSLDPKGMNLEYTLSILPNAYISLKSINNKPSLHAFTDFAQK